MKIKLCLINPPHPYLTNPEAQAPLGLLYVASSASKFCKASVNFVNLSGKNYQDDFDLPKADIYGLTGTVLDKNGCEAVARFIRARNVFAKIILGGPIVLSKNSLSPGLFDSFVHGEGELVITEIIGDYPKLKREYRGERIFNLDNLPIPSRHLINGRLGESVFAQGKNYFEGGSTVISTSRGCPFACTFCASPKLWGRKIVYRSAESIADEVKFIVEKFGVRQLRFSDDNLTNSRPKLEAMCKTFEKFNIAWRASIRSFPNDMDMMNMMKKGGCVEVCFGTESGDDDVLQALKKGTSSSINRTAIENAKKAGLDVRILFMIGTPGETHRTVQRNIDFLDSVDKSYDSIALTNFTPLPGCAIADDPEKHHCSKHDSWDIDTFNLCLWGPEGMNQWRNFILPDGMTMAMLTAGKKRMIEYIISTNRSNQG